MWREPTPEVERILIVDITATQARAKGAAPSANHEGGQTGATATKTPSALPPPTVDGLDRMYHQPAKIHAIATMQLVERAHWQQSDPTSSPIRAGIY
jgi:ABC-type Na+ efflux pump permease subunit